MQISRLELHNFKTFQDLIFDNIPLAAVLVSPNGLGKSSILESIVGVHEIVSPYHKEGHIHSGRWNNQQFPMWPPHLPKPLRIGANKAEVKLTIKPNDVEKAYLVSKGLANGTTNVEGSVGLVIEEERLITSVQKNPVAEELFKYHNPRLQVGFVDYFPPIRQYAARGIGDFVQEMSDDRTKHLFTFPLVVTRAPLLVSRFRPMG